MSPKKHLTWLIVAILLLVASAMLMWTDKSSLFAKEKHISFPTEKTVVEKRKQEDRRRSLLLLQQIGDVAKQTEVKKDPFMVAISSAAKWSSFFFVFEFQDIIDTPIGKIVVDCLQDKGKVGFDLLTEESGFSIFDDIERIAIADKLVIVDGHFDRGDPHQLFPHASPVNYGDFVEYNSPSDSDDPHSPPQSQSGIWQNQIAVFSESEETFAEAVGLLRGEVPYEEDAIDEDDFYGEIHGTIDALDFSEMFSHNVDLEERFLRIAKEIRIHVDARKDVALVAEITSGDQEGMMDLVRTLGGALSIWRIEAKTSGNNDLAELLDYASIRPQENSFQMELALPFTYLQELLEDCKWAGKPAN